MNGRTANKVYKMMKALTVEQIKEMRDVHGHKMLELGRDAYRNFIHQCDYMIEKKSTDNSRGQQ